MAFVNLRWLCAPLLFVSSVASAQDSPALPPVFTSYVVPYGSLISTPRGEGACVAGFVEAICSTGGTNQCFSYKEDDGNYYMRVRSTGYYCGEWEESNNQLLNPPEAIGLTDSELSRIDNLFDLIQESLNRASHWRRIAFSSDVNSMQYNEAVTNVSVNFSNAISHLRNMSSLISGSVSSLRDYTIHADEYYESIKASNDSLLDAHLKIGSIDSEIAVIELAIQGLQGLANDVARIESDLNGLNFDDIQEILDSIGSLGSDYQSLLGGLNYAFETINKVQSQIYDSMNDRFASTNERISDLHSSVFSQVGNIYDYINDEISGVSDVGADVLNDAKAYTDGEISTLADAIDAGNADIASSIDSQTGEITGAIDGQTGEITDAIVGQTSTLGSKLDGISFNLFDFAGKFDSFSDYIKGKIAGFEDSMTDGLPSGVDVDSQTGELSSLIDDKDFSRSYSIEFGAKQCPEPISVYMSTLKRDIEISFELFCQFADIARLFVLASAYIMALMITMGVSRRA